MEGFTLTTARGRLSRREALARDVLEGFARRPRELPPHYFYDDAGSAIYEEITRLDEYYLTRVESSILQAEAGSISRQTGARELLEIGPGSATKALVLARALSEARGFDAYVSIDCCESALRDCARDIRLAFPRASVHGILGDFGDVDLAPASSGRRLVAFLGSTLGNLERPAAEQLLTRLGRAAGPDGFVLLGTDLVPGGSKTKRRLELAYDDPAGVTARFNRNVLEVMNRELGAGFRPEDFHHRAPYLESSNRIEMQLVANRALTVRIAGLDREYAFGEGEVLRTEICCKYDRARVEEMLGAANLRLVRWMTDPEGWFALSLSQPGLAISS